MSVVCVARYSSVEEALVAKSKLEFYGIPVCFPEENAARFMWVYLQGASLCHLEVPTSYAEDASFLLADTVSVVDEDYGEFPKQIKSGLFLWMVLLGCGPFSLLFLIEAIFKWLKKKN